MKAPKAYYIDIDGTLTSGHNSAKLNYIDIRAIKAAARDGAHIILLTGRAPQKTDPVFEQLRIDNSDNIKYIGCNNGAVIYNGYSGETLTENYMSKLDFVQVFQTLYQRGYLVKTAEYSKYYAKKNFRSFLIGIFTKVERSLDDVKYNNVSARKIGCISHNSKRKVRKIAKELEELFPGIEVAISGPGKYLEITNKGANKGYAVEYISELINVDPKDSVHIGDSMNDAAAFEKVGTSVALKNGMKELKKMADFVGPSQKSQGVAKSIDSLRQKRRR